MPENYVLLVDESGEAGIKRVRDSDSGGASQYMVLGAALVPESYRDDALSYLAKTANSFGKKQLHCSALSHTQKVYFSRTAAQQKFLAFGVLSFKHTLGSYKEKISGNSSFYYNKCAQYLLERVALFMNENEISNDNVNIVFEEGNFNYSALRSLILKCQKNPLRPETKLLAHLDAHRINARPKSEEPLLQLADLVAHSLFKCVDKSRGNFFIPEPRYFTEIRSKFYQDRETGHLESFGLKAVHSLSELKLDSDIQALFEKA